MSGQSGEIIDTGRSLIRIHGGRQESYEGGKWRPNDNPSLKMTYGCLRAYDSDMEMLKTVTDALTDSDKYVHTTAT